MSHEIRILGDGRILSKLSNTPYPPDTLYIRGSLPPPGHKLVTIVGSRRCSQYAKQVVDEICQALAGQPVSIVSGLALGIDSHAHECAIKYGLHTMAVLGCGLDDDVLYPRRHQALAHKILACGGALISEYESHCHALAWMFPARNRIMVGIADLVIVAEARERSGTLITARMATDYNRDLLVVPNSIYSPYSKGSNDLIRQGAYIYMRPQDVCELLGFEYAKQAKESYVTNDKEKLILKSIAEGNTLTQEIIEWCTDQMPVSEIIQNLLNLEIENVIKRTDGTYIVL